MGTTTAAGLRLPTADGAAGWHPLSPRSAVHDLAAARPGPPASRQAYAAAHVVGDPLAGDIGTAPGQAIDWDATLAFRRHLWSLGLGVADAMDTAQRGGGLGWPAARELIARSGAEARAVGGALACGAATDQLPAGGRHALPDLADAYVEQAGWIRQAGGIPVLMASRQLAAVAADSDDYGWVYDEVLSQLDGPVMLHWLGEPFDPAMGGYWGDTDLDRATDTVLEILHRHAGRVTGIKISLLDADREVAMRRRLPAGVRMFTGDDFSYDVLVAGDEHGHSDALLGILDAIAAPARAALDRLDDGDTAGYAELLAPTVPLARLLFAAPTSAYKTGIVFLAWLNGHQRHFHMLASAQGLRSVRHLAEVFRLADAAGALADPELAAHRMRAYLAVAGFEA